MKRISYAIVFMFIMISVFALSVGAEDLSLADIPAITEVTEELLTETPKEVSEVELYAEGDTEVEAEIYDGEDIAGSCATLKEAITTVKNGTYSNIPVIKLVKDVELCEVDADDASGRYGLVIKDVQEFILDGDGHTVTDMTANGSSGESGSIRVQNTKMTARNITFTRTDNTKECALFNINSGGTLILSDSAKISGNESNYLKGSVLGSAVVCMSGKLVMDSESAEITYCNGQEGVIMLSLGGSAQLNCGSIHTGTGIAVSARAGESGKLTLGSEFSVKGFVQNLRVPSNATLTVNGNGSVKGQNLGANLFSGVKLILDGEINISGNNKNFNLATGSVVMINSSFKGTIEIDEEQLDYITGGTGFTGLDSVKSIIQKGTNGNSCAYYDEAAFKWTKVPVITGETDSGFYTDSEGNKTKGVIRYLTTFEIAPTSGAFEKYGTYAMSSKSFITNSPAENDAVYEAFTMEPEDGKSYIVDVIEIPSSSFGTTINAISFVKLKGVKTPVYYNYSSAMAVTEASKNLGIEK